VASSRQGPVRSNRLPDRMAALVDCCTRDAARASVCKPPDLYRPSLSNGLGATRPWPVRCTMLAQSSADPCAQACEQKDRVQQHVDWRPQNVDANGRAVQAQGTRPCEVAPYEGVDPSAPRAERLPVPTTVEGSPATGECVWGHQPLVPRALGCALIAMGSRRAHVRLRKAIRIRLAARARPAWSAGPSSRAAERQTPTTARML
jgi:hypothetical protein